MVGPTVQLVPSLLFYDLPRIVEGDPAARTIGNVRRWLLVVVVLVDAEWCFSRSDPRTFNGCISFLCERKNISGHGGFRDIRHFAQAVEIRELSRRDSIGKRDSLRMDEGVIDLVPVSENPESSTSLHESQQRQLTSEPDPPRSKRSTPPNSLS